MFAAAEKPAGMVDIRSIEFQEISESEAPKIREPVVDLFRLNPGVGDEDTHGLLAFAVLGPTMDTTSLADLKASGYALPLENHAL